MPTSVPTEPAKGGKLKIVLYAAGQGVNVNFQRVGISAEQLAAESAARKAALEAKKAEAEKAAQKDKKKKKGKGKDDGAPSASDDLVAELVADDPSGDASFQFRAREVQEAPSAVTTMMQSLCGKRACGAVVSAEEPTLMVRVVSLIGAVYADGAAPPVLAFELPWTKKPVPPPAPPAPTTPAAP